MAAGTFTVTGLSASEPTGERVFGPITIQGQQVIGETLAMPMGAGDNTIAVPTGAVAVWIQGPINGAVVLKLRTNANSSDSGLPINGTGMPLIYPFPAAATPATLIINANGAQSALTTIAFI